MRKKMGIFSPRFLPFSIHWAPSWLSRGCGAGPKGSTGVAHISPWHCWAGMSPAWDVGQPHGCDLCVRSVVMVTWGWHREEGPLLWTIRMALAIESFVAKEVSMGRVNTEHAQSFCPSPGDKWLQVVPEPRGDPGVGVMCGSLGCYLDCTAPYQEPRFYGRRAPKDRQMGLENECLDTCCTSSPTGVQTTSLPISWGPSRPFLYAFSWSVQLTADFSLPCISGHVSLLNSLLISSSQPAPTWPQPVTTDMGRGRRQVDKPIWTGRTAGSPLLHTGGGENCSALLLIAWEVEMQE